MKKVALLVLILLLIAPFFADIGFANDDLPRQLRTLQTHSNYGRFALISSMKNRLVVDKHGHRIEVVTDDQVTTVNEVKPDRNTSSDLLERQRESRKILYSEGLVLFSLTNILASEKGIVAVHTLNKDFTNIRVIQVLDEKLTVVSTWEDETLVPGVDYRLGMEPLAVSPSGLVAALGEPGEVLVYSVVGEIVKSIVIRGVFNQSRDPVMLGLDLQKNYHLSPDTVELVRARERRTTRKVKEFIQENDRRLEGKRIEIPQLDSANINGLFFLPDNSLNILVGSRWIYSVNMSSAAVRVLDLADSLRRDGPQDDLIYQILCKGWELYLLTRHRVLRMNMENGLHDVSEISLEMGEDTVNHWTVLKGEGRDSNRRYFIEFSDSGKRIVELGIR